MDIGGFREEYTQSGLCKSDLLASPHDQFELWFNQAVEANLSEPNAMSLATVDVEGKPHVRTVLLKSFDQNGFVFYTNYNSQKGQHIQFNHHVEICFLWLGLERQVRIEGRAKKVESSVSSDYFSSRPRSSQIGALVSPQSAIVPDRDFLHQKQLEVEEAYEGKQIKLPSDWGGYCIMANAFEFWQGRKSRLHDRFKYILNEQLQWEIMRLAP